MQPMITYIALLRGINVGGHNKLPMKELRALLEDMSLKNVKTYIQSGNVVFASDEVDADRLSAEIASAINAGYGFEPRVLLLTANDLAAAMSGNPFPEGEGEPKSLHLYFLSEEPAEPNLAALQDVQNEDERFKLQGTVFYLHAPSGIGRSKLAERVERVLGVPATARNWRSVSKIMALANE
ncbi:MAG: DUF1697 domain-containing protein [Candidatus Promineifilaceae bacterium]